MLTLFIALITMNTFYINIYLTDHLSKENLLKFNIVTQITYFSIVLYVLYLITKNLKKETHYKKIEIETTQFRDYMHSLELINTDMQKFRHDHSNILFTMQGYIETDDFEGLKTYFSKHIFSAEADILNRNKRLANLSNMQITGIKGLILTKSLQADKEGLSFNVEIPELINEINMNILDIARILGIFLDNAIEANKQPESKKEIDIAFFKSESGSLIIIVENTMLDNSLNIEQVFKEGFSSKGDNRGEGLIRHNLSD